MVSAATQPAGTIGTQGMSTMIDQNKPAILNGPRPLDQKKGLEYDIEMERYKINQMETRFRSDLERIRTDHSKTIDELELKHSQKRKVLEEEK